jgi:hypothetical protein
MFAIVRAAVAILSVVFAGLPDWTAHAGTLLVVVPLGAAVYAGLALWIRPRSFVETIRMLLPILQRTMPRLSRWCKQNILR